jgi:L-seryl-tRNA(Ser) seleniumtransferase
MPNEALICHCQRFLFDQAIRTAGAKLVEIGDAEGTSRTDMAPAINESTAFGVWVADRNEETALPFRDFCEIAHDHGLPVLVDNAAEVPPVANLAKYSELGADLVVFSGGKGIRGPQDTGLILGRADLIAACAANSNPHHSIGRPLKVGKEEICGLVRALELYVEEISKRERDVWEGMVAHILAALESVPGVRAWRHFPYRPCRDVPVVAIELSGQGRTVSQILQALESGDPPIFAPAPDRGFGYAPGRGFIVNPHTMLEGEERIVARRLREVLG